ncbi:MAG: hypothetical protein DIZ80_15610 [endosymbiont of Galathealinum brachiosum]|uniref:Cyclic nucleotide-binding domain-containing protein n=1 Tax=endosymbiont of Galathealinum brachiosum TaxID=2200906 RepID=A0A370D9B8_9GAMM|nr:MAG: hypothetical protein DIZ80_15610 [endosymbiont of Galathealinum brachiosum]
MAENILHILSKIPLFNGLNNDELKIILNLCQSIKTDAKEVLFKESDPSHEMYILLSGEIKLSTQKSGTIFTLGNCDIFGEIGLITQRTRSASAVSLCESSLLCIHHIEFNLLAGKHPRIFSILMKNISTNLANHVIRMNNAPLDHIPDDSDSKTQNTSKHVLSTTQE